MEAPINRSAGDDLAGTAAAAAGGPEDDDPIVRHTIREHGSFISSACIVPDFVSGDFRPRVFSVSWSSKVLIHDAVSGDLLRSLDCPPGETISCLSVCYKPGACDLLGTFSLDGKIRIYDGQQGWSLSACFGHSPKGMRSVHGVVKLACPNAITICVSGGIDKVVRVRDLRQSSGVLHTLRGHTDTISSLDVAESGVIASGSADTNVRLWDYASGAFIRTLRGHILTVSSVRFVANSPWLLSAGLDGTFRVWDHCTGQRLRLLKGNSSFHIPIYFRNDVLNVFNFLYL